LKKCKISFNCFPATIARGQLWTTTWGTKWLSQAEERSLSPSIETLPKQLDSTILASMSDLVYNPHEIQETLLNRKYSEAMATYLILREQTFKLINCTVPVI
jgi:hypothetical protein